MSEKIKNMLRPEEALTALIDAAAAEILAASDDELASLLAEAGEEGRDAIGIMRRLVNGADGEGEALAIFGPPGARLHAARGH
jgi:hypothetical protein